MKSLIAIVLSALLLLPSFALAQRLLVQPDDSGSMRASAYESYVDALIPAFRTNAPRISGIEVMPFASRATGSWNVKREIFEWGALPENAPFDPQSVKKTLAGQLFQRAGEREIAMARDAHQHTAAAAIAAYWGRVDHQLEMVRARLLLRPGNDALCTSFVDLALRSARNHQPQLVITDGVGTCSDPDIPISQVAAPIALVLLPSRDDRPGGAEARAFISRQNALRPLFPGAAITTGDDLSVVEMLMTTPSGQRFQAQPTPESTSGRVAPKNRVSGDTPAPMSVRAVETPQRRHEPTLSISIEADTIATVGEALVRLIQEVQRRHVRESFGPYAGQCFTDQDLAAFVAQDIPRQVASAMRSEARVGRVLGQLSALRPQSQAIVLNSVRKPLHKSWTELGHVTPLGQTDAGVRAELLIANAIVDLLEASLEERRS